MAEKHPALHRTRHTLPRGWLARLTLTACLALAACSQWPGSSPASPSPSWAPGTAAVVPSTAPTSDEDYTCPGIPDAALEAMFGTDITMASTTEEGIIGSKCSVHSPYNDNTILVTTFGHVHDNRGGPWNLVNYQDKPKFTFDEVEGAGVITTSTNTVLDSRNISTVFVCGDSYLDLVVTLDLDATPAINSGPPPVNGDLEANLVNLTHSALPWLCQGQVVPGLGGQTLEEARPPWARSPSPPDATPTSDG